MPGPITIRVVADTTAARAQLAATAESTRFLATTASRAGKLVAGAFAVGALTRGAVAVGKVGASYVDSLNKIQALTGASNAATAAAAKQLEAQSGQYAKYGQTVGDAAAGVVELTKSGLSLSKSLTAVRSTLVLAKAGELDVGQASTLVANTLNTFHLRASAAASIANDLANAANISSADVTDLAESFKYVSPLAAKSGVSLKETNAILAELANSGIKASQAGTSLRSILLALQAPSTAGAGVLQELGVQVYDARGKMRDLSAIVGDLRSSLGKLPASAQNADLKAIFGKIGITGATTLIQGGTKAIDAYTKSVTRAGAAQKLAEANTKGLAGTLSQIKAEATSGAQALYRQFSPTLNADLQAVVRYVEQNKQAYIDAAEAAEKRLVPALEAVVTLAVHSGQELASAAGPLAKEVLPVLGSLADVTKGTAEVLDKIPGPIKSIGLEALAASLLMPRLAAGVSSVTASAAAATGRLQLLTADLIAVTTQSEVSSEAIGRLGATAKAAAGVGGFVALTASAQSSNKAVNILGSAAGGALAGFSVGGPIGAGVGAVAGELIGLASATRGSSHAFQVSRPPVADCAKTLRGLAAAATEATRNSAAQTLSQAGLLTQIPKLGLTTRDVVSAVLGQGKAYDKVTSAIRKYQTVGGAQSTDKQNAQADAAATLGTFLDANAQKFDADRRKLILQNAAAASLGKTYKGLPKSVATKFEALGSDATRAQVEALGKSLKLTPKQIQIAFTALHPTAVLKQTDQVRQSVKNIGAAAAQLPSQVQIKIAALNGDATRKQLATIAKDANATPRQLRLIFQAGGVDATRANIAKIVSDLKTADGVKPSLRNYLEGITSGLRAAQDRAQAGAKALVKNLTDPVANAKGDLSLYSGGIVSGVNQAKGIAASGGHQVGTNLGAGTTQGLRETEAQIAAQAANNVRHAIEVMKAEARTASPSKETHQIGVWMGQGLEQGLAARTATSKKAGHDLVAAALAGITNGSDGIGKALDRIAALVDKKITGKNQDKQQAAVLKSLKAQETQLRANGRAQDANNAKLQKAVSNYQQLVQAAKAYAAGIKDAVVASGSVVGLGADDSGTVQLSTLLDQLQSKVNDAKRYGDLIRQLTKEGLNNTTIQQLLDAGVDGGLSTAEALQSGGAAAIKQVNTLTNQLTAAGSSLGSAMEKQFKQAGVQAAAGIVAGLTAQQKQLDAAATRLGDELAAAVRKALGIKSPSTVFRGIGADTLAGLQLGLGNTYVKRVGANAAAALASGFGTPALSAYSAAGGASTTTSVSVQLTAEQLTAVQQGRAVALQIDAASALGKRTLARNP